MRGSRRDEPEVEEWFETDQWGRVWKHRVERRPIVPSWVMAPMFVVLALLLIILHAALLSGTVQVLGRWPRWPADWPVFAYFGVNGAAILAMLARGIWIWPRGGSQKGSK